MQWIIFRQFLVEWSAGHRPVLEWVPQAPEHFVPSRRRKTPFHQQQGAFLVDLAPPLDPGGGSAGSPQSP